MPVVVCFIGEQNMQNSDNIYVADTLEDAAVIAVALEKGEDVINTKVDAPQSITPKKHLRGLYSGGTLAFEANLLLQRCNINAYSNAALNDEYSIDDPRQSKEHTVIDMGDDWFTRGKPHPMIDFDARLARIEQEASDNTVGVILLDVMLGTGSHEDPASLLAPVIQKISQNKDAVKFVIHVCGTDADAQNYTRQSKALEDAGAFVSYSNVTAVYKAYELLGL